MAKSGRGVLINKRRERVLELKITGLSLRAIAEKLTNEGIKCSYGTVRCDLDVCNERSLKEQNIKYEKLRAIEVERCESMISAYWDKAQEGDEKAANIVDKFMDRKEKLFGLHAPEKFEAKHTVETVPQIKPTPEEQEKIEVIKAMWQKTIKTLENDR